MQRAQVYRSQSRVCSRRTFLRLVAGTALASPSCTPGSLSRSRPRPVRFGVVTDCHYAQADPVGTRFYRESLSKLSECVARMNAERVDFLIELGDLKDQDRPPVESRTLAYLERAEAALQRFRGPRYHVLGNHDMDSISKHQFLSNVDSTHIERGCGYYSFDVRGLHCVVLDANYDRDARDYDHGDFDWKDANIPAHELDWLRQDLADSSGPAVVFIHQLLDGTGPVHVKNASAVREILEASGRVLVVFQGHHHEGAYSRIKGIHYYTLRAVVEGHGKANNAYAIAEAHPDRTITVQGYRKAVSMRLAPSAYTDALEESARALRSRSGLSGS